MEKCQHGNKITHFCIYQYCSSKEAAGCETCLKKYHSHVGNGEAIKTQDVDTLAERFNVQNTIKPKCRQFQEYVFSFFTLIKTQIVQSIDIVCKGMVNKIGYPLLSNLNHLSSYKRIKNKEYKKLGAKELKKFHLDCKGLELGGVTGRERELYVEEIIQNYNTIQALEKLMKQYENLAKRLCRNFKHDSSGFKKIQDLRKYLNSILKIDKKQRQYYRLSELDSKVTKSNLQTSPSEQVSALKQRKASVQQKQNKTSQIIYVQKEFQQIQQSLKNKNENERNSRNKYKHLRNFSVQRQSKINEHQIEIRVVGNDINSYESKEKEILQRKQKLMKMMSLKQKSVGKVLDSSVGKNIEFTLIAPPLLKYQKNESQKTKKSQIEQKKKFNEIKKYADAFLNVQTPQKQQRSTKFLASPRSYIKHSLSAKSFKEQLNEQNQEAKNQQQENQQKYKYAMCRLPSSESNSSETQNLFKSYLNSVGTTHKKKSLQMNLNELVSKGRKDKMSQSSPVKIQLNISRFDQVVIDEQKSAGLYLKALQLSNDEAIKYLKAALSYSPKNISAAQHLCSIYIETNNSKQCLDLCNQYLGMVSKFGKNQLKKHFIINKAASLNNLGRYSQSITLLQSQIIHFEDAKMYKNLGDAYFFVGINEKCQYNYQKAVKINSKFDEAMYNLAVCMYTQRNYFNADIWIAKALQFNNKNSDYQILKQQVIKKLDKVHEQNQDIN